MADDARLSSIIDDEGRLFGLVNIIDAAVVGLALILIAGGLGLWVAGGSGATEAETRYVTVELESHPTFIAEQISEGDQWNPSGTSDTLTITDVYHYTDDGDGNINTIVRAEMKGTQLDPADTEADAIDFAGSPVRYGSKLEIEMSSYGVSGTVVEIDRDQSTLQTGTESFVIEMDLDKRTADSIAVGDRFQLGESDLVVLETVTVYPIPGDDGHDRRAIIGATGQVQFDGDISLLGQQQIRTGSDLTIQTQANDLSGNVIRVGSPEEPGTPDTRTATVELSDVSLEQTDALSTGLTEETEGLETAEIVDMTDQPAQETVVIDGNVATREDPLNRDVTLAVELNVRQLDDGEIQFRGESLEIGQEIAFDFGTSTVEGQLTDIE
ncbi:DUF4330 domain-containing protein [Natronorubrum bangense]|uniref:DUF4330 domain-containing protein n=1 Tax=Natronorubrum bangense JCM 10635 TaxID=1227500 RepID=L9VZJ6_9EURY|nr:DUF4330 domain-containing protein [Natronorubrum bangense]ELY42664.1 hypothetical protein C494_20218 [Natronorubrum bangense JCM 10635]